MIHNIFDNCADEIGNGDALGIFKYIYEMSEEDRYDALPIYAELISNMCDIPAVLKLKNELPLGVWLMCAAKSNITDIDIDTNKLAVDTDRKFNDLAAGAFYDREACFDRVTLTLGAHVPDFYLLPCIATSVLICNITQDYPDDQQFPVLYKLRAAGATTSTAGHAIFYFSAASSEKIFFVPDGFSKVILDPNMKSIPTNRQFFDNCIKTLTLPETDGIQLPRWIVALPNDVVIYKKKGQKVSCYKNQTEWVKKHLQSI